MILTVDQCSYTIGNKNILDAVSFGVNPGERLAVVGPNGAGKSTLLKVLCRIIKSVQGTISLDGQPLADLSQKELARWISYVPQTAQQSNGFTVEEYVLLGRYPHLSPFTTISSQDLEVVANVMELTGTQAFKQRLVRTLSSGEQQKVMIAAALAQEAKLILLDEPAAFLDPYQQEQVYRLLERISQEKHLTLLEVTHDVNRAALGHHRILGLRSGKLVFDGTPRELMTPRVLEKIYGKAFTLMQHPAADSKIVLPEASLCS